VKVEGFGARLVGEAIDVVDMNETVEGRADNIVEILVKLDLRDPALVDTALRFLYSLHHNLVGLSLRFTFIVGLTLHLGKLSLNLVLVARVHIALIFVVGAVVPVSKSELVHVADTQIIAN
jgi:hypothetical protein